MQINRYGELPRRTKRHSIEWRFVSLRWSLASQQIMGGGYFHRAFYRLSRPVCRFVDGCSCRASAVLRAGRILSSSRYITGTLLIAIDGPFPIVFAFIKLRITQSLSRFDSGKPAAPDFKK